MNEVFAVIEPNGKVWCWRERLESARDEVDFHGKYSHEGRWTIKRYVYHSTVPEVREET